MAAKGRAVKEKQKILWCGDAVSHTGFARVTHEVLSVLHQTWDVHVLGVNYYGDPHEYPYNIYPAALGGDVWGVNRLPQLVQHIKPDVVVLLNDPWVCKDYMNVLNNFSKDGGNKPFKVVCYVPIDSPNISAEYTRILSAADCVVAYTKFGLDEMKATGLSTSTAIIPHGLNTKDFYPIAKKEARERLKLPEDWFIVGCVNRNQPRKRMDLALEYFTRFAKGKPDNIRFYFHGALKDVGWDLLQLADYYGIQNRIILTSTDLTAAKGAPKELLKYIYSSFDVQISTTIGEGWGLTTAEGMACKTPQIVPDWSALGEWCRKEDGSPAVAYVPITSMQANTGGINTIGGIADRDMFIAELDKMYADPDYRASIGSAGYALVRQTKFTWSSVASQFDAVFKRVLSDKDNSTTS